MTIETPERIWLIDHGDGEVVWCNDPDPDGQCEPGDSVEYVRADTRPPVPDKQLTDVVEAAKAAGSALDDWIRITDVAVDGVLGTYVWTRPPTHEEVQEAMRANNVLAEALASLNTAPAGDDVRLRQALELARNRLRAAAINEAGKGTRQSYEYSEWADEADAALKATTHTEEKGS